MWGCLSAHGELLGLRFKRTARSMSRIDCTGRHQHVRKLQNGQKARDRCDEGGTRRGSTRKGSEVLNRKRLKRNRNSLKSPQRKRLNVSTSTCKAPNQKPRKISRARVHHSHLHHYPPATDLPLLTLSISYTAEPPQEKAPGTMDIDAASSTQNSAVLREI